MAKLILDNGEVVHLPDVNQTAEIVGRDENCQIQLPDSSVSKKHAKIGQTQNGKFYICDLGSSNGTFLNGTELPPNQTFAMEEGDKITFGGVEAIFSLLSDINTQQETIQNAYQQRTQVQQHAQITPEKIQQTSARKESSIGNHTNPTNYAGFWIRFASAFIDGVILVLIQLAVASLSLFFPKGENGTLIFLSIVQAVIYWLYYALLESSSKQATIGKMVVKIYVTDLDGKRLTFARASGRYWAKLLSMIIILIGYVMAAFSPKKQALHDMVAGCLVLKR